MTEESRRTVFAAMGANFAIAAGKLMVGIPTGSAALLAEAGHSLADTVNQVFLLIGLNLSRNGADEAHPHGHGKEGFFWSFLAAICIFVAGAAFSVYEGVRTLAQEGTHNRTTGELLLAFAVLGMAFAFESVTLAIAVRSLSRSARERGWTIVRYIRQSPDLTTKTVFWEDSAAIIGLVLAAIGIGFAEITGNEHWDGVASIAIGGVLALAALILGMQSRSLLLGAAASTETRDAIRATVTDFPEVTHVVRLLTMQLGTHSVLVTGELQVRRDLTTPQIEDLMARIDATLATTVPEVSDTFWELRHASHEAALAAHSVS
jgi:cation diffusion facilitator family transporter